MSHQKRALDKHITKCSTHEPRRVTKVLTWFVTFVTAFSLMMPTAAMSAIAEELDDGAANEQVVGEDAQTGDDIATTPQDQLSVDADESEEPSSEPEAEVELQEPPVAEGGAQNASGTESAPKLVSQTLKDAETEITIEGKFAEGEKLVIKKLSDEEVAKLKFELKEDQRATYYRIELKSKGDLQDKAKVTVPLPEECKGDVQAYFLDTKSDKAKREGKAIEKKLDSKKTWPDGEDGKAYLEFEADKLDVFAIVETAVPNSRRLLLSPSDAVSPTSINQLTVKWNDASAVDENGVLQLKPKNNNWNFYGNAPGTTPMVASADLYFDISGSAVHAPGTVELRLPAHIFPHRNGGAADTFEIACPKNPPASDNTNEFAWTLDDHGTADEMDDELVLVNVLPLDQASQYSCTIKYTVIHPATVKDETTTRAFYTDMKIDEDTGSVEKQSNRIEAFVDTETNPNRAEKSGFKVYDSWQSSWGTKPAGYGDGDIYVIYYVRQSIKVDNDSQPYTVTLVDTPLNHNGEVIGYSSIIVGNSISTGSSRVTPPSRFQSNPPSTTITNPVYAPNSGGPSNNYQGCFVLVHYSASEIAATGSTQLRNQVTFTTTGVDDKIAKPLSAETTFNYRRVVFTAPPGNYEDRKDNSCTVTGGIEALLAGKQVEAYNGSTRGFFNWARSDGYELTLKEGGDPKNPGDYNQRPYTVELVDDMMFFEDDENTFELGPNDYEFTYILMRNPSLYEWVPNTAQARYESHQVTNGTFPDITYYGQFGGSGEWVKLATAHYATNGGFSSCTVVDSRAAYVHDYAAGAERLNLSGNCTAVKAVASTTQYRMDISYTVQVVIKPSDRVVGYIQGLLDEDPSANPTIVFTNVNTQLVYDSNGRLQNVGYNYSGMWADRVEARDQQLYGTAPNSTVGHKSGDLKLTGHTKTSYSYKSGTATNDPTHKRVILEYTMYAEERIKVNQATNTSEILENGIFTPQKGGTFYDLLPLGVEPDMDTIKVGWKGNITSNDQIPDTRRYKVTEKTAVPNWRGTGRTMLIVRWESPPDQSYGPRNRNTSDIESNAALRFNAYYSWEAAEDYGLNPLNSFAYETANDDIHNGRPDDGGSITERNLMVDLNDDGNPEDVPNTFLYGQCNVNVSGVFSSYAALEKHVRLGESGMWDMGLYSDIRSQAGGTYQYRLRYVTATATTSKNIVFYDSLESYKPDEEAPERDQNAETWQGTFVGLDLTQPCSRGVAPVVYYSTINGLDIGQNQDLTDTSVWTPASEYSDDDLSSVHAIAVDLSTKTDGTPYVLPEKQSLVVIVNMRAPDDVHEANAYAVKDAAAFNQDWASGQLGSTSGHESEQGIIHTEYTRLLLTPVNVDIPVKKVWNDDNDRDRLRTESVKVRLLADGEPVTDGDGVPLELELNDGNDWQGVFQNQPEYVYEESGNSDEGGTWREIEYTLEEVEVPESYSFESSGDSYGLVGTNVHAPSQTSVPVAKVWDDGDNQDGTRPSSVTVHLLANGEDTGKTLTLSEENTWKGIFTDLNELDKGEKIEYSISEEKVEGYQTSVTGSADEGFTITNSHTPGNPEQPKVGKSISPKTGDTLPFAGFGIAMVVAAAVALVARRKIGGRA